MAASLRLRGALTFTALLSALALLLGAVPPSPVAGSAHQPGPFLLADVNPGVEPLDSSPSNFTVAGDTVFFSAVDETHGRAIWASDGTEVGTRLVYDLDPSNLSYKGIVRAMAALGPRVVFVRDSDVHGTELWVSDGTAAGTHLVQDINPGAASAFDLNYVMLLSAGGLAFFAADDGTHGLELWVSDGTTAGTRLVRDIAPGSAAGLPFAFSALAVGPLLYFEAQDVAHGAELWVSDGTTAGTHLVKDINPGPATGNPYALGALGETLYLTVDDGVHGYELWRSEGTAEGTALFADINPGPESSYPVEITGLGDSIYMLADDGAHGQQLWRSDGAPGDAVMVAQLGDGPEGLGNWPELTVAAGRLYLVESRNGTRIWASDGTSAGTVLVRAFGAGAATVSQVGALALIGFNASTASPDSGLWTSDGTPAGTVQIVALSLFAALTFGPLLPFGDLVLMSANSAQYGIEPWVSDGTAAGTRLLKDINHAPADGEIACLERYGERLYFSANDGVHGAELWVSDGTPERTMILVDLVPGPSSSSPCDFTPFAGALTFVAGGRLWRSDGTAAGTAPITDSAHPDGIAASSGLTVAGDLGFFTAGPANDQLWALESDLQSASLLRDFELVGKYGFMPLSPRYVVSGRLIIGLSDLYGNASVWASDGTPEGTLLIEGGWLLGVAGGRALYLASTYGRNSGDLVGTDGTLEGTAPVFPDLITPPWFEEPISVSADGWVFFTAPRGLMVSDGSESGSQLLVEPHWHVPAMATAGGRLFFVQEERSPEALAAELWTSDGTAKGTRLLRSFAGPWELRVDNLTLLDGALYFAAGDVAHGRELWTSDGTSGGTLRCLDLNPGPAASSPLGEGQAAVLGDRLIFAADDGAHGRELWSVAAGDCALKAYLPLTAR